MWIWLKMTASWRTILDTFQITKENSYLDIICESLLKFVQNDWKMTGGKCGYVLDYQKSRLCLGILCSNLVN